MVKRTKTVIVKKNTVRKYYKKKPKIRRPLRTQVPYKMILKQRYHDAYVSSNSSSIQTWTMRANDVYDPREDLGGHQPRGFDQMMLLYSKFVVVGSKITVQASYSGALNPVNANIGLRLGASKLNPSNANDIYEDPTIKTRVINDIGGLTLTKYFSLKKWSGGAKPLSEDNLQGFDGASPNTTWLYQVMVFPSDGSTSVGPVSLNVTVDYIVMYFDPIVAPISL